MKRIFFLLLACGAVCTRCTDRILVPGKGETTGGSTNSDLEGKPHTSYWYYTYEASDVLTNEAMGIDEATGFVPYTVAQRGDTLFIANIASGSLGLIVFDKKNNKPLKTVTSWTVNGAEKTFISNIEAIVPNANRLYVAERQSCIHVFGLPGLDYITCIGNGQWSGPVFQAQAVTIHNGLIFARDKTGNVSVYKEELVTPENYQKIARYKQAGAGPGDTSNNGFVTHYMEPDKEGHILLTGYNAKVIRVLDPSLINNDFKNGTSIDLSEETIATPFNPKTFATASERLYATGGDNAIHVYDRTLKEWVSTFKSIKGFAFTTPIRIFRENDTAFWISDNSKYSLVKMNIYKGEIREYSRIDDRLVRVKAAATRSGEEAGDFCVDLRTHEIVDPADVY